MSACLTPPSPQTISLDIEAWDTVQEDTHDLCIWIVCRPVDGQAPLVVLCRPIGSVLQQQQPGGKSRRGWTQSMSNVEEETRLHVCLCVYL